MADQAAGLRRRVANAPVRSVLGFFASDHTLPQLAYALRARGVTSLRVQTQARPHAARSLFDWPQQLARAQLHVIAQPYGDDWDAPGLLPDAPGLTAHLAEYDAVLFDLDLGARTVALIPNARHWVALEVDTSAQRLQRAFACLKTLAAAPDIVEVCLLGERRCCARLRAACARFLPAEFTARVSLLTDEDAPLAALAVRMTAEETGFADPLQDRKNLNHGW